MDELRRRVVVLAADHKAPLQPNRHYGVITFDDGFVSVVANALPGLRDRNLPWAMFVPTGSMGRRPGWIQDPSAAAWSETVLSETALRDLANEELLLIGSHTITHRRLTELERAEAERELRESKVLLEGILGEPVTLFSFPHGAHNDAVISMARASGYQRVFTVDPELAFQGPDEFRTGRVSVDPGDWPLEFRLKILGAYRWMALLARWRTRSCHAHGF